MELHELEKKRDAYAGRIAHLAIHIALIFAIPAGIALLLKYFFEVSIAYTLPVAFVLSWILVIRLYRKIDKTVRTLEEQIRERKKEESLDASDTQ